MNYNISYDIATIFITVLILLIYKIQKSYLSYSRIRFLGLAGILLLATASDIVSAYTMSYSQSIPVWLNYAACIVFYISFGSIAGFYCNYVIAITKGTLHHKYEKYICISVVSVVAALNVSTPWTHLMFYYNENLEYVRGPLFYVPHVLSAVILIYTLYLFISRRAILNRYQCMAMVFGNIAGMIALIIQMIFPMQLITCFACSLSLYLLAFFFENPDSYTNRITSCYNEKAMELAFDFYIHKTISYSIISVTIDEYKYIRKKLGTASADKITRNVAEYLLANFPRNTIYDLGNCNFVILLDEKLQIDAIASAATIVDKYKSAHQIGNMRLQLTPRVAIIPDTRMPVDKNALLHMLYDGMLEFKSTEDNKVSVVTADFLEDLKRKDTILEILNRAIANDEFQVYYQPIYNTKTNHFSSAEALLRLYDEDLGFIPPAEFIPLAEEHGLIAQIGEITFRKVCSFVHKNDLLNHGIEYIEVNLSTIQCMQDLLAETFHNIMEEYHIEPRQINFEITESSNANEKAMMRNMTQLIKNGSSFSIDDYGTGFSNTGYLISLPLSLVKIDKSILWNAMKDAKAMMLLKSTIQMIQQLDKKIVVEGVETEEMKNMLVHMNVDYLQGYYYSRPIPEKQYLEFIQKYVS